MKILIVGAGEVGIHIAKQLIEEGKEVVVIEKNLEIAKKADSMLDCKVINGEGTSLDSLKEAGAHGTDVFIAATSSDEVNLISCFIVAAEFSIPKKIARISNIKYSKTTSFISKIAGVDYLVNTEREAAWEIYQTLEQGANSSITTFDNPDVQIRDIIIEKDSFLRGMSVEQLRREMGEEFIVAGVVRGQSIHIPDGKFILNADDVLCIASLVGTFYKIYKKLGNITHKLRKIVIVGGTPVGKTVAELLSAKGRSVIMIDKDYSKCKEMADILPNVMVLNGDISEQEIYDDEQINMVDAIVTTTSNDELNIISGVYAKTIGIKRAIAMVEKTSYIKLAADVGIDSTVSRKFCAINSIIKTIRKGRVRSVHVIFDGNAEAIEVILSANSKLIGKPIKDLTIPDSCLILSVMRDNKTVIPNGNTILKPNDNIIIFLQREALKAFEEFLI